MEFFDNVGGDPLKPSLFELVAQEQLRDLLQPALKYVLSVFAQRYPRYLLRIVNRHEDFYALIMFFVERHYLRTHNASFAENFYGLKRRRRPLIEPERAKAAVGGVLEEEKLRGRETSRSLFFLIAIPYLRSKAQDYYEDLGGGVDLDILEDGGGPRSRTQADHTFVGYWRRLYKSAYPWLNLSLDLWLLVYNVAYLFDQTPFYRPWLAWIGVDLRRVGIDDLRHAALSARNTRHPTPERPKGFIMALRRILLTSPRLLLESLKVLLLTAIFFIKFLEWWYSPSSPARSLSTSPSGPSVPPPQMLKPHPNGVPIDGTKLGQCPLCREPVVNATALPSGYVFCYRCAHEHVERHGTCPVTLIPARIWQLRKIMI